MATCFRLHPVLLPLLLGGVVACGPALDSRPFVALSEGRALDGREGLEVYAPDARAAVLRSTEEAARYWGRRPEMDGEVDRILASHDSTTDAGQAALYAELRAFVAENAVFTETEMRPGLHDLRIDGEMARADRIGHNPGGEFREEVRFVRLDGRWYMTTAER